MLLGVAVLALEDDARVLGNEVDLREVGREFLSAWSLKSCCSLTRGIILPG